MYWDRFDICEAYLALEMEYSLELTGIKREYISNRLYRMKFKASPLFKGYDSLSENGKEIYLSKAFDLKLINQTEWEQRMDEIYGNFS